jgi:hypothetical protein
MSAATKALDAKIINYLSVLSVNEKKAVLSVVETFAKEAKHAVDFWDELAEEQQTAIDKAIKEADEGKLRSHKEVMRKLRK